MVMDEKQLSDQSLTRLLSYSQFIDAIALIKWRPELKNYVSCHFITVVGCYKVINFVRRKVIRFCWSFLLMDAFSGFLRQQINTQNALVWPFQMTFFKGNLAFLSNHSWRIKCVFSKLVNQAEAYQDLRKDLHRPQVSTTSTCLSPKPRLIFKL